MQELEDARVRAGEISERCRQERGVELVHTRERGARTVQMIEERIVEIEEHCPNRPHRCHPIIIRTGCMVD